MRQAIHTIHIRTDGPGLYDVTRQTQIWTREQGINVGVLTIWCRHTSASLIVQENADPDVQADLVAFFRRVAPENGVYRHDAEGPDDMPAHIKAALTQPNLSIPVEGSAPVLGTWQAIYLFEHRTAAQTRSLTLHLLGE